MFCREYLIDLNATQAAIRAGYSEKTAYSIGNENLNKPEISERIQELNQERVARVEIDADWVLKASKDLYDKCMEAEPVLDSNGASLGFAKFHPTGAAKAIELVGKHVNIRAFDNEVAPSQQPININLVNPNG